MVLGVSGARAEIAFDDVSAGAGIDFVGQSFGLSWGDFDGDGWADVWVTHHVFPPSLFVNQQDGTFVDIGGGLALERPFADMHGAAWADFDNDGDQDLLQLVGNVAGQGVGPNHLFVNEGGTLVDRAPELGVEYPFGGGYMPTWLDWDGDGLLDAIVGNLVRPDFQAPTALFAQRPGGFVDVTAPAGFSVLDHTRIAQISNLTGLPRPHIVVQAWDHPQRVFALGTQPLVDVAPLLSFPTTFATHDVAISDFDGDLVPDMLVLQRSTPSDAVLTAPREVRAHLVVNGNERGIEAQVHGPITVEVGPSWRTPPSDIYIGAAGAHPGANQFFLDPNDPAHAGIAPHTPGVDAGMYIGWDAPTASWRMFASRAAWQGFNLLIETDNDVADLRTIGFAPKTGALPIAFLTRNGGTWVNGTVQAGLATPRPCGSVVPGDFDNDGDVDVYLVCARPAANFPNVVLENDGNGVFSAVADAGDADGAQEGRGETAGAADFDQDGYLDLYLTNGAGEQPFDRGPDQLLHNRGGTNHWLQIDLEGVSSNRNGIGARLLASAGGVTQLREQSGGIHRFTQDHERVHFGLGAHTRVDSLVIHWPSGTTQVLSDLPADQIVRVIEPRRPTLLGRPSYAPGSDPGAFVWKDSLAGPLELRVSGDGSDATWTVRLITDRPLRSLAPVGLQPASVLEFSGNAVSLQATPGPGEEGLSIGLAPGADFSIAVERDGDRNPRLLHVGVGAEPASPSGWILPTSTLTPATLADDDHVPGCSFGLESGQITARWRGGPLEHATGLSLTLSAPLLSASGVGLEAPDVLTAGGFGLDVTGAVAADVDGVDADVSGAAWAALVYRQDGIPQPYRVNAASRSLGAPNASEHTNTCDGDIDGSGGLEPFDLFVLLQDLETGIDPGRCTDIDGDGSVTQIDFLLWFKLFKASSA